MLFVMLFALFVLGAHWFVSDSEFSTKLIVTVAWLATWLGLFVNVYAMYAAQALFTAVVGGMTFGPDWLNRRM